MAQTIEKIEETDGIRLTWNIWPVTLTKHEMVPLACLYNVQQPALVLPCEPIFCHSCQAILCPQATLDFASFSWMCVFCGSKNSFPSYARDITPGNLLPELIEENSTVEYVLNRTAPFPSIFLLLVDRCTYDEERHGVMKAGLRKTLEVIPDDAMVGIVCFGTNVELLSFGGEEISTIYLFSGATEFSREGVSKLGLGDIRNFLVSKKEHGADLLAAIDGIEPDPFPVLNGFRARRCTGSALSLAVSLLEGAFAGSAVRYMVYTQGPCTLGPGKVQPLEISLKTAEKLDSAAALSFYTQLGERVNNAGHAVDIIAETIADIGIDQLKPLVTLTGGALIMAQDFDEEIKIRSIEKLFERDAETGVPLMGFDAKIQVRTSSNLEFKGFIGEGRPLGSGWRTGSILPSTNITLLFENTQTVRDGTYGHVQIITQFQRASRQMLTRVTTFSRMFSIDKNRVYASFDQEAACVFQARAFIEKGFQNVLDFESAIDKNLIRFTRRYGTYEKGNAASVFLPDSMSYFPNFMFFFRRSLLVQRDGISEDESAYFRILVHKLRTADALKMIKPALIAFHYQGDVAPVELDSGSLDPESILVLDSFHNVLLWRGAFVDSWYIEGLHEQPGNEFFRDVLQEAATYGKSLLDRLPVPQYRETGEGKSQARILLHYVNPSQQGMVNTEKIDYEKFYDTLCKFIVKND
ncbi:protein transport protein SEC23 [Pancytospora philotis]|nr:protein transport protein SEC23 [Pancytospora philotis]